MYIVQWKWPQENPIFSPTTRSSSNPEPGTPSHKFLNLTITSFKRTIRLGQRCIDDDFAHQGSPPLWAMPSSLSMGTPKDWKGKGFIITIITIEIGIKHYNQDGHLSTGLTSYQYDNHDHIQHHGHHWCSPRHRAGILGLHHRCSLLVLTRG